LQLRVFQFRGGWPVECHALVLRANVALHLSETALKKSVCRN
jgi:hypothetical protein